MASTLAGSLSAPAGTDHGFTSEVGCTGIASYDLTSPPDQPLREADHVSDV
ncbi:hypothetical protein [Streptomyces sp. NBC_00986]|uniref:hypothetical protein n=1 Tax=Streptomyces sp. NBC_00986 TaxID=2903702 RepID=UPI00386FB794|nr:hypothetical protein OG504_33810 [Streptomyces sp. NBC_00986]